MINERKKIFVGISGGVDSSVSAYLLKKAGHDVHGIFVKTWSPEWLPCTWQDEKRDAMRICAALDIPFSFLDAEEVYKNTVAEYMIAEYKAGRTPNPDVLCNREIKFGVMWDYAKAHGADALATGHYAQTHKSYSLSAIAESEYDLLKGKDPTKDQSYFLWMLTRSELSHIVFPIGHLQKSEVRDIAEKVGLFTATKKDSQGICFLGDIDMKDFLKHYIKEQPGEVINEQGLPVGKHDGVWFYTFGERHGFTITEKNSKRQPYFVVGKNIDKNQLIVSHIAKKDTTIAALQTVTLRESNWLTNIDYHKKYHAQIRYHGIFIPATILDDTTIAITPGEALAFGQSVVLYDGEKVVGGGVIDSYK